MKKIMTIFIVVLISLGIADVLKGVILTFLYTPNSFSTNVMEMSNLLSYTISATTVTIILWSVFKLKNLWKGSKSMVKVS
ncbi:hypothetical protein [Alkalihalobacillus trypoxylicola]|uniref:Uncharacterized protein n=1 Tax=Alkalihalobacillus trypoxylicola TaxID=519424 RepID=A0A161QAE0_9BACI|nr:hypothetical protein [Alkalihalobacillus trypoxylicola]KYG34797.1 hypothetical protein AZF04_00225 [Alkalihalobacillus trypoxylicola]